MTETSQDATTEEAVAWANRELQRAVEEFWRKGVVDSATVEAKPAWAFPFKVMIGKVREHKTAERYYWLVHGDLPFDYLVSDTAETPREAARHFALKWQLEAAQHRDSTVNPESNPETRSDRLAMSAHLETGAETLYELVRNDSLWTDP